MSDRYTGWFRSNGDPIGNSRLVEFGKKLLGAIANQQRLGAPPNLIRRTRLTDGSEVTAQILHGQPRITVKGPPEAAPEATCELYVESGLLDLGANTAADAAARFGRGRPTFAEGAATLHFGTGVDCSGYGGLNGKVQVGVFGQDIGLRSACLSSGGSSAASQLTDPDQKQCQAVMPSSLWSGHMARYIAALYGGKTVRYRLATANAIELFDKEGTTTQTLTPWASSSWGLVQIGAGLLFVEITSGGTVRFRRPHFGRCGQLVYQFWQQMGNGGSDAKKSARAKVLTVALSDCEPALDVLVEVSLGISGTAIGSYGWAFDTTTPRAATVLLDSGNTKLYEVTFASDGHGSYTATPALVESKAVIAQEWAVEVISPDESGEAPARVALADSGAARVPAGATYDFPITCWYEAGARRVIRYAFDSSTLFDYDTFSDCDPTQLLADDPTRFFFYYPLIGGRGGPPDSDCSLQQPPKRATVVCGLYCTSNGSSVWSKVVSRTAPQYEDSGSWYIARSVDSRLHVIAIDSVASRTDSLTDASPVSPLDGGLHPDCSDPTYPPAAAFPCLNSTPSDTGTVTGPPDPCPAGYISDNPSFTGWGVSADYDHYVYVGAALSNVPSYDSTDPWRARGHYAPDTKVVLPFGCRSAAIGVEYALLGGSGIYYNLKADTSAGDFLKQYTYTLHGYATECTNGVDSSSLMVGDFGPFVSNAVTEPCTDASFDHLLQITPASGLTPPQFSYRNSDVVGDLVGSQQVRAAETFATTLDVGAATDFTQSDEVALALDANAFTPADFSGAQCATDYAYLFRPTFTDAHADVATSAGTKALAKRFVERDAYVSEDFQYRALRGRLAAAVLPQVNLTFGASVGTDRETLSGGYSGIASPSFIGWA